jgi:hypothetical protein
MLMEKHVQQCGARAPRRQQKSYALHVGTDRSVIDFDAVSMLPLELAASVLWRLELQQVDVSLITSPLAVFRFIDTPLVDNF